MNDGTPGGKIVLRTRLLIPVAQPPIENAAIIIAGDRIQWLGRWDDVPAGEHATAHDLGEVVVLPGLVNAHCHLDYTSMAGQIAPTPEFTDWLKLIMTSKAGWTFSDFSESWLEGAKMLVRTGTTLLGDVEMAPELLPDVWTATPLRVVSFLEMTGVKNRRPAAEIVREAMAKMASLPTGRCRAGLSPHAPYSTTPELLRLAANAARTNGLRVTTHVAESQPEFEMFCDGRGGMFEWIARSGREMSDCGLGSPVRHLYQQGALGEHLLAIHVNYLQPGDAELLGRHHVSVVHCPRSRAYFRHDRFPYGELTSAGVNICLGTDSLASVYRMRGQTLELNMFDETRAFAAEYPEVAPGTILRMATANGARALGMGGLAGELSPGAHADLIAIPYAGNVANAAAAIVDHKGNVSASMIGGNWAIEPGDSVSRGEL